ncbi:hydralysin-2 [Brevibacillus antibioticus]|uniref:Hydralysin-2 n=1 Tax=Brevibacillus antibioticus TaxID=2570228 RepID=A0A4U2YBP4_9BACL|nr:hydralysin-2 [Brevibacillus antibioticus]TKI58206.1 hydralysin-2 [Brevibacillus antibioticus]
MSVQEKLLFADLPALNSSPESVRQAFKNRYGVNPDGIALNSETYFDAVEPAITERYGHPCYKTVGPFSYSNGASQPPIDEVVSSHTAVNRGKEKATLTLEVQASWMNEQSWSSESTTGLTISTSFGIEGVFQSGLEFSISTTVGESKSETESKTATATVEVTVPAKSKKKITMVGTKLKESMEFTAPIEVTGRFGANFPKKVEDHYYKFTDAALVLNKTTGEIKGTIKNTVIFDVNTEIGESESLTPQEIAKYSALDITGDIILL